jgi:hypothetical protein
MKNANKLVGSEDARYNPRYIPDHVPSFQKLTYGFKKFINISHKYISYNLFAPFVSHVKDVQKNNFCIISSMRWLVK